MSTGEVILLNGTSSVGKSTIARSLQDRLEQPFLHTGLDHFLHRVPGRLIGPPTPGSARGWEVDVVDGVLTGPPTITALGYQVIGGVYAAIAAYCRSGNNAVVDDVIYDPRVLRLAQEALHGLPVLWVGLDCTLEEAERREVSRGDRALGGARTYHPLVHRYPTYDVRIDVTSMSPAAAAEAIADAYLQRRRAPGASSRESSRRGDSNP